MHHLFLLYRVPYHHHLYQFICVASLSFTDTLSIAMSALFTENLGTPIFVCFSCKVCVNYYREVLGSSIFLTPQVSFYLLCEIFLRLYLSQGSISFSYYKKKTIAAEFRSIRCYQYFKHFNI